MCSSRSIRPMRGVGWMALRHRVVTARGRGMAMSLMLIHVVRRRATGTTIWTCNIGRRGWTRPSFH
jgi:hypothetical protein